MNQIDQSDKYRFVRSYHIKHTLQSYHKIKLFKIRPLFLKARSLNICVYKYMHIDLKFFLLEMIIYNLVHHVIYKMGKIDS